jgi:NADP-dependent 3-hydroxy acid dehydrogenase YdfG
VSKHLVIIGAGPGLALENARRFGAAGYRVTLLGRTLSRLDALVEDLSSTGVHAVARVVDATDHEALRDVLREVDAETAVDVCLFQPGGTTGELVDVLAATVENVRANLELLTLGAVAVGEAMVPAMTERGSGSLVFIGGGSARLPLRFFGNLGPAMAGLRNYAMTLDKALKGTGLSSSFITVAGMITDGEPDAQQIQVGDLSERILQVIREEGPSEVLMTPGGEVPVKTR